MALNGVLPSLVSATAHLDRGLAFCVVRLQCLGGHFGSGRRRKIIYTKPGVVVGDPRLGWRADSGETPDALSSSLRFQDHQVLVLILVTDFDGRYLHYFNLSEPLFLLL